MFIPLRRFGCNRGLDNKLCRVFFDGVLDSEFATTFSSFALETQHDCFSNVKIGDSPSNSLDNSMIGSNFSTFTAWKSTLLGRFGKTSQGGLGEIECVMYGISTVEAFDWRLSISIDATSMDKGSP